ncbi:unnamed protein product [Cuscuta europaea]|uniref:Uncharacterized protein n=1 Tax=Cuscuta europaea TaxID=41803 RepID=A0A9P0ZR71_CUSEU|nr:unnamed protein product [Cuscuta europaea]
MDQSQLQKAQADEALILAQKQLQEAQEAFRLEKKAFGKILENSMVVARAEGRADAKKMAAEAAKKAAEDAEAAREEAVAKAWGMPLLPSSPRSGRPRGPRSGWLLWWRPRWMSG